MYVDLSAIAKRFAVDEVARLLEEHRITSHLVDIGGELRARGSRPDGSPWTVAVEQPFPGKRSIQTVIALRYSAIATSGDCRRYMEIGGRRYSHTINPNTGRPITHGLASVSVIAASAMNADALATAIMVMGPDTGFQLAVRDGLAVQLIIKTESGLQVWATSRFMRNILH